MESNIIEVSNQVDAERRSQVLSDPFQLRFRVNDFCDLNKDNSTEVTSPDVVHGSYSYCVIVNPAYGESQLLKVSVRITSVEGETQAFDGTVELVLHNQTLGSRNMRINSTEGCFSLKPDVLRNHGNGWLSNGSLLVEAIIRTWIPAENAWQPKPQLSRNMAKLLHSGVGADLLFSVEGKIFKAHRVIVALSSDVLGFTDTDTDTDNGNDNQMYIDSEPTVLNGISANVFAEILSFIYTDDITNSVWDNKALEILEAADRYNILRLKILAELEICRRGIALERVSELLIFADSHACPQLKETCLERFVESSQIVMQSPNWNLVSENPTLLSELLLALSLKMSGGPVVLTPSSTANTPQKQRTTLENARSQLKPISPQGTLTRSPNRKTYFKDDKERVKSLKVGELRKALSVLNLNVDGPREILEERLISSNNNETVTVGQV